MHFAICFGQMLRIFVLIVLISVLVFMLSRMRSFSVRSTLFRKKTKKTLRQKPCQRLEKNRVKQINSPLEIKAFFITGLVARDLQPWPGPDCKSFAKGDAGLVANHLLCNKTAHLAWIANVLR